MRQRLYVHVVWTTRDRRSLISARVARFLTGFLRGVARQEGAQVLEIGLAADHVHLLVRLDVTTRLPRLVQRWKGGSAAVARQEGQGSPGTPLRWSKGYAIQSVSPRALPAVRAYLRAQAQHHPDRAIAGWDGDESEFDPVGHDEWRGQGRARILARRVEPDPSVH
jgi:putative transposase